MEKLRQWIPVGVIFLLYGWVTFVTVGEAYGAESAFRCIAFGFVGIGVLWLFGKWIDKLRGAKG